MHHRLRPWIPAIFCAILSLITITANLVLQVISGIPGFVGSTEIAFYCFLPMCFYFVGASLSELQRENGELRMRLEELSSKAGYPNPPA